MPAHQPRPRSVRQFRRAGLVGHAGLTILELLVVLSIVGILAAVLLPALGAARETTRRAQCVEHLREIGIAMHNHHNAQKHLPAGWQFDEAGESATGWAVSLLPHLGQTSLAERVDTTRSVDDARHDLARSTSLEFMLCPSDIAERSFVLYGESENDSEWLGSGAMPPVASSPPVALCELPTANYVGVFGTIQADDTIPAPLGDGTFLENRRTRFRDFQRGLSHTAIVGERTMAQVPSTWLGVRLAGEDAAFRLVGSVLEGINHPLADEGDFSSRHPGGANFLWGDGHVRFVTEQIDLSEYHRSAQLRRGTELSRRFPFLN